MLLGIERLGKITGRHEVMKLKIFGECLPLNSGLYSRFSGGLYLRMVLLKQYLLGLSPPVKLFHDLGENIEKKAELTFKPLDQLASFTKGRHPSKTPL